ncbi:MAG: polysaccharide deacetylase family protein, partial [Acidimicrobiia bacterium]|nr:polysaccharide deacetylase family protein [Acidimicrobiia bacterium]
MAVACFTVDHLDDGTSDLLDVFERRGLRTTVFVEGRHGEERPERVAQLARRGHEVGMHGWAHEQWDALDVDEEETLARRATDALAAA